MFRFKTLLFAAACALPLAGCLTGGDDRFSYSQMLSARWISGDSVLAYTTLSQTGTGSGYESSTISLYTVRVTPQGFAGKTLIHMQAAAVGCADLRYEDSLLFYSYVPLDEGTGKNWGRNCADAGSDVKGHASRLAVVKPGRTPPSPVPGVDTLALRAKLLERPVTHARYAVDEGIEVVEGQNSKELFCVGESCLGPY